MTKQIARMHIMEKSKCEISWKGIFFFCLIDLWINLRNQVLKKGNYREHIFFCAGFISNTKSGTSKKKWPSPTGEGCFLTFLLLSYYSHIKQTGWWFDQQKSVWSMYVLHLSISLWVMAVNREKSTLMREKHESFYHKRAFIHQREKKIWLWFF